MQHNTGKSSVLEFLELVAEEAPISIGVGMPLVSINDDMMARGGYYVNSARLAEISTSPANRVPTAESGVHPSYVIAERNNCAFTAMCNAPEKLPQIKY